MRKTILLIPVIALVLISFNKPDYTDIQCDGVISEGEWKDAKEYPLNKKGKLLYKKENDVLYVAMIGETKGWGHVYLSDGSSVKVIHASAALGQLEYKNNNGGWRTNDTAWVWLLRDRVFNAETGSKMNEHYKNKGWVANNVNLGDGKTIEFKIDLTRMNSKQVYFACVMADYNVALSYYPAELNDNTILPRLVQGYVVNPAEFKPATWKAID